MKIRKEADKYIRITRKEWVILIAKTILVILILDHFFYKDIRALPFLIIPGLMYAAASYKDLLTKKRNYASIQFKELLINSGTALRAGYSIENAFLSCREDMKKMYGKKSFSMILLDDIRIARNNNLPVSDIFVRVGKESGIEDIGQFGEIYGIAYTKSGNLGYVLTNTSEIIIEKLQLRNEIFVTLNEKTLEMKIMTLMPFLIMAYVKTTSPDYFSVMYENPVGVLVMSAAMILYCLAYLLSRRMILGTEREVLNL